MTKRFLLAVALCLAGVSVLWAPDPDEKGVGERFGELMEEIAAGSREDVAVTSVASALENIKKGLQEGNLDYVLDELGKLRRRSMSPDQKEDFVSAVGELITRMKKARFPLDTEDVEDFEKLAKSVPISTKWAIERLLEPYLARMPYGYASPMARRRGMSPAMGPGVGYGQPYGGMGGYGDYDPYDPYGNARYQQLYGGYGMMPGMMGTGMMPGMMPGAVGMGGMMPGMGTGMMPGAAGMGMMPGAVGMGGMMPGMGMMPMGAGVSPGMGGAGVGTTTSVIQTFWGGLEIKRAKRVLSMKDGDRPKMMERDVVSRLKQVGDTLKAVEKFDSKTRSVRYINAMATLIAAIEAANKLSMYSDTMKYSNAQPNLYKISQQTLTSFEPLCLEAKTKLAWSKGGRFITKLVSAGALGDIKEHEAFEKFALMVAELHGKFVAGSYVYKALSPDVKDTLDTFQAKAEHRIRKVFGKGLRAIERMISFDVMGRPDEEVDIYEGGLAALDRHIASWTREGIDQITGKKTKLWKPFGDDDIGVLGRIIALAMKRLDLGFAEAGFDSDKSYELFSKAVWAMFGRVDLMARLQKTDPANMDYIWKNLPNVGKRVPGGDKKRMEFFEDFGVAYRDGLEDANNLRIINYAAQKIGRTGFDITWLIPAGEKIYVKGASSEAVESVKLGIEQFAWCVVEVARQLRKSGRAKDMERLQGVFSSILNMPGVKSIPVFAGVPLLISQILERIERKLAFTVAGALSMKDIKEPTCYAEFAKLLNLMRGNFKVTSSEMDDIKPGIDSLYTSLDERARTLVTKRLAQAVQKSGFTRDQLVYDVDKLSVPERAAKAMEAYKSGSKKKDKKGKVDKKEKRESANPKSAAPKPKSVAEAA